jgi:phospholipase D1/2
MNGSLSPSALEPNSEHVSPRNTPVPATANLSSKAAGQLPASQLNGLAETSPASPSSNESNEFPFNAQPGETGVSPTNDLVHRVDYAAPSEARDKLTALDSDAISPAAPKQSGLPQILESDNAPQGRRSVQFAHGTGDGPETPTKADHPPNAESGEPPSKERQSSSARFMNKLKVLASPMALPRHARSLSSWTIDSNLDGYASEGAGDSRREDEDDADAEGSAGEVTGTTTRVKSRRRFRRALSSRDSPSTAPTTPRTLKFPSFRRNSTDMSPPLTSPLARPHHNRSNTMSDIPEHNRFAYSEDEGNSARRRSKRPSGFRRITGIGTPKSDRNTTTSAQKWRQLKASLKLMSAKKKDDRKLLDHAKSAELMAELLAVTPAAMMFFSMFQRDKQNHKRIPVLLEQLKVRVTDSIPYKTEKGDRHVTFRIELEYATAYPRMKWVIHRNWVDLVKLHRKYKFAAKELKDIYSHNDHHKLPKFPGRAIPYLRGIRGLYDDDDIKDDQEDEEGTGGEQTADEQRRPSLNIVRRTTSAFGSSTLLRFGSSFGMNQQQLDAKKDTYAERARKRVELYLQQLMAHVIFRVDSNRLCRFLELSALGIRLAAEGSYHGKEGRLLIQSTKGVDFRKSWKPKPFWERHRPKWFLVRHSYIVCVEGPEDLRVYDVFLVDPAFRIDIKTQKGPDDDEDIEEFPMAQDEEHKFQRLHTLKITNSERITKLLPRSRRQLRQWEDSIKFMLSNTEWAKPHRFDSFAPVRKNVWTQFLVDGQDYLWNVSRAIDNARDVIYIHDWWLSPELYLRRPAAISQDWRLDRLLKKKADQGVKIFVIIYRNVESAIPISSDYTKQVLINLGPNVIIQRSPNQLKQNTFFWAHHEKVLIVDHCVAFAGGVDLCFGRWDTPEHRVCDDKLTGFEEGDFPRDADHCQLWPGKDYSNPRVQDFYSLSKPYEEMYDRTQVPRMPWHDVGMQMVGQPARDLSRHFVQRWNFLLRQRASQRPRPMLIPPPDFLPADLETLDLTGTCDIQILRSACDWSLGIRNSTEHSIMTAYVDSIERSEHLVYIENQFFITSCNVKGTVIKNEIGDALVKRIIRAHENQEKWRAFIVIPLVPGFQNKVDAVDGTSVRVIMECQYYSICRGETSIFGRLQNLGINPLDFIEFYALRSWGRIGPDKSLVSEQLYIHAKILVVDDRIAIIGSANINERSMLGNRDSEIAVIVEDKDIIDSRLAGREFKVSRFAHEFRMRLMREHLGLDVCRSMKEVMQRSGESSRPSTAQSAHATETRLIRNRVNNQERILMDERRFRDKRAIVSPPAFDGTSSAEQLPPSHLHRMSTAEMGLPELSLLPALPETDDTDIGGPPLHRSFSHASLVEAYPQLASMQFPILTRDCMIDPVDSSFYTHIWHTIAENNTRLFRMVFRCMPDSEVKTWDQYHDWDKFYERFKVVQHGEMTTKEEKQQQLQEKTDSVATAPAEKDPSAVMSPEQADAEILSEKHDPSSSVPMDREKLSSTDSSAPAQAAQRAQSKRRKRATTKGSIPLSPTVPRSDSTGEAVMLDKGDAEEVLKHIQGHLVVWPYDWLVTEMMETGAWSGVFDKMSPLEIYT